MRILTSLCLLLICCGCEHADSASSPAKPAANQAAEAVANEPESLADARARFSTKLLRQEQTGGAAPPPPSDVAQLIKYPAKPGPLSAYLTNIPADGELHPAIVWISGGDSSTIDDGFFAKPDPENDQTASAFGQDGIVTMYVSLRGGNDNPGYHESFYGEVDDVIAAYNFLASQKGIDPKRIYLGGHSTGGTLALVAAEMTDKFRAVFSFGPAADVRGYGEDSLVFDTNDKQEVMLRSPIYYLHSIRSPTFVFEGAGSSGNVDQLELMKEHNKNAAVHFYTVPGKDHFSVLAPVTRYLSSLIQKDTGPTAKMEIETTQLGQL